MSSVFSSQDQFCPFWDQFFGFACIIRLGDHFCLGITFAAVQVRWVSGIVNMIHLIGILKIVIRAIISPKSYK